MNKPEVNESGMCNFPEGGVWEEGQQRIQTRITSMTLTVKTEWELGGRKERHPIIKKDKITFINFNTNLRTLYFFVLLRYN